MYSHEPGTRNRITPSKLLIILLFSTPTEMGSLPRRHIGELPSERRLRLKNERKTYNKFVNMSYKTEDSFGPFLMEALMKYSCKSGRDCRDQRVDFSREYDCKKGCDGLWIRDAFALRSEI